MNSYFEILLDKIYLITHDYWNYGLTLHKFECPMAISYLDGDGQNH